MTIRDLYEWAKENDMLDKNLAIHYDFNCNDVRNVVYVSQIAAVVVDRVVLD